MQKVVIIDGNIFTSKMQTIVNTINCVGIMGAGIALECRLRYPEMFRKYVSHCKSGNLDIGKLWLFRGGDRWILNFPTKKHWKYPSKEEYIHCGLQKFVDTYQSKGIKSIAFPVLGAQNGGLSPNISMGIMLTHLEKCDIPVEIYRHNPQATDDLFIRFKQIFLSSSSDWLKSETGLTKGRIETIRTGLLDPNIFQINQLAKIQGIGDKTLEKAFLFMHNTTIVQSEMVIGDLDSCNNSTNPQAPSAHSPP